METVNLMVSQGFEIAIALTGLAVGIAFIWIARTHPN
jgi:hypothetical protein